MLGFVVSHSGRVEDHNFLLELNLMWETFSKTAVETCIINSDISSVLFFYCFVHTSWFSLNTRHCFVGLYSLVICTRYLYGPCPCALHELNNYVASSPQLGTTCPQPTGELVVALFHSLLVN